MKILASSRERSYFAACKKKTDADQSDTCAVPSVPPLFTFSKAYGPLRDKTRIRVLPLSETQTSPTSYWEQPEYRNLACSKLRYQSFYKLNNKGADQSARIRRPVCALVARKPPTSRPILCHMQPAIWNTSIFKPVPQPSKLNTISKAKFSLLATNPKDSSTAL